MSSALSPRALRFTPLLFLLWATSLPHRTEGKNISTVPILTSGTASLTHYDFPLGAYGSCGCSLVSTYYPTAALSQAACASSSAYGPACGMCFNLTLVQTVGATPEWVLDAEHSAAVVVKVTDKCPAGRGNPAKAWCGATDKKANKANQTLHFDLSAPSPSIPMSFFPTNESFYGYSDFGSWLVRYEEVSCEYWAGWTNETSLGIDATLTAESACCPANPSMDDTVCASFSLKAAATPAVVPDYLRLLLAVFVLATLVAL
ncbi:hypothetical protein JCM11641_004478 [Rhodosporidiobolus odoratus]